MKELAGLMAFALAGSISPGPNNTVLWASGMTFGFRRTLPHVIGTAIGIGALVAVVAAGVDALLRAVPALTIALKVAGSLYLLYVAYLVLGSGVVKRAVVSHPLSLAQAVAFQFLNPKAWIFAIALVGTFLAPGLRHLAGIAAFEGILMTVVVCSAAVWAGAGAALGRVLDGERARRAVSIALAALLVASVALIWI